MTTEGSPLFVINHLPGCTPLQPCVSCEVVSFLKSKLSPEDFAEFVKRIRIASRREAQSASLDEPILILKPLRVSMWNALVKENCRTIADVCKRTEAEWRTVPNVGDKSIKDLKSALQRVGHQLGEEVPEPTSVP